MELAVHQTRGFYCLSASGIPAGVVKLAAAAVNIHKGDYLIDDGSGYATNTATDTSLICYGIAAEPVDNSGGSSGDKDVLVIPFTNGERFSVPVGTNAVINRGYVGALYDLNTAYNIDISDTTVATGSVGFWIEDFDAGTVAVAANTYGYAIGRLRIAAP